MRKSNNILKLFERVCQESNLTFDQVSSGRKNTQNKKKMTHPVEDENVVWSVIQSYFNTYGYVRHQIESFDYFMMHLLPHIIRENSSFEVGDENVKHRIEFVNMSILRPTLKESNRRERTVMPFMTKLRGQTYAATILIDVVHDILRTNGKKERRVYRNIRLAQIPVMLHSHFCYLKDASIDTHECIKDQGGYFIINGIDKVLVAQEKLHTNCIYTFTCKPGTKYSIYCEIRSCHELKYRSTSTFYMYLGGLLNGFPEITCQLPFIEMKIPFYAIFMFIGNYSRQEIYDLIFMGGTATTAEKHMVAGILDTNHKIFQTREDVIDWLGREGTKETTREKRTKYLHHIVMNECFPHVGVDDSPKSMDAKAVFLGRMVRKLVQTHLFPDKYPPSDRDHYAHKRVDSSGMLISLLFRQLYRAFLKSFDTMISKMHENGKLEGTNLGDFINGRKITSGIKYAFSTGVWGIQKLKPTQTGVAQILSRMTIVAAISNLRRINTPINRESKAAKPRMLHNSSWGIICGVETPEGSSCGLTKNLSSLTHVRIGYHSSLIVEMIERDTYCNTIIHSTSKQGDYTFLVNGYIVGYVSREGKKECLSYFRRLRRKGHLPFDTSVYSLFEDIVLDSDAGCLCRPVFVVEHLDRFQEVWCVSSSWDDLLREGVIEYLDKHEENEMRVAMWYHEILNQKEGVSPFTHLEIHPSLINGLCAALIPFSNHNQAPRNVYQSAMCKQAIGVFALNFSERMDTVSHVLSYPQRPLVSTKMEEILFLRDTPSGMNPIVAIMCYTGFNQEDSLILNQASVDRGLFHSFVFRSYKEEERVCGSDSERIEKPSKKTCSMLHVGKYDKIGEDGIVKMRSELTNGDAIIGKTMSISDPGGSKSMIKKDKSVFVKNDKCKVDMILKSQNKDGNMYLKVRVYSQRVPIVGDKACHTPDHDVLTDRGWVSIAEVKEGDKILCHDPERGSMCYESVQEKLEYDCHEEDMYEVNTQQISLKVTMNHKMFVKTSTHSDYGLKEARELVGEESMYRKKGFLFSDGREKGPVSCSKDLLWIIGMWFGCGWTSEPDKRITLHCEDLGRLSKCLECIERSNLPCVSRDGLFIHIYDSSLFLLLKNHSVVEDERQFPGWVFELNKEDSGSFLTGYVESHGFKCNLELHKWIFHTVGKCLKDDVMRLSVHSGYASNYQPVTCLSKSQDFNGLDKWKIEVSINGDEPIVNKKETCVLSGVDDKVLPYTGKVYCVTVRTHIFYVRRNGKACWTGNSSRHGQKGVVGIILRPEDMPYTKEGITPDLIVNPHAIPSRMTIGHLMECLLSKTSALNGKIGDGTPFRRVSIDDISSDLESFGYEKFGNEEMCCGMTGKKMPGMVFLGPTHYQRLKHMVTDKEHSRSRGPKAFLTRQPVEGRSREGGLRFGEMERDVLISHGVASMLRERLFEQSDPFITCVCKKCGILCIPSVEDSVKTSPAYCKHCKEGGDPTNIRIPYAFKLLLQEMMAMHVAPRLQITA